VASSGPSLRALPCALLFVVAMVAETLDDVWPLPVIAEVLSTVALLICGLWAVKLFRTAGEVTEMRRQARTDELTGLTNRRAFFEAIKQRVLVAPSEPVAILMLDLDRFKDLNDTLGHRMGDLLLERLGDRIVEILRPTDTAARLGGDEFAVLCPGAAIEGGRRVAQRLQDAFQEPFELDGLLVHADASIGIATYPTHGDDAEILLQRADVAMYQAKAEATGFEVYDPERDLHSRERLLLAGELRRALQSGEQVVLHYQPQLNLETGIVESVEALVRWEHPDRGLLPPGAFLGTAESGGLMRRLTRYVLHTAVAQAAAWRDEGLNLRIAVNLAATDLADNSLADEIGELLAEHALDGDALKFELTESDVMSHPERAVATMTELHGLGCTLALDDFGTGHSSLAHLKTLPVDELKIDRSFVMRLDEDPDDLAIVRAATGLARDMNLRIVAEGVETEQVCGQLGALGCHSAQGYFIAKPLPEPELRRWLAERDGAQPLAA
jgi:diguanylate cyclase (GGDEF)-like protein